MGPSRTKSLALLLAAIALALSPTVFAAAVRERPPAPADVLAVSAYRRGDLGAAREGWLRALEDPSVQGAERARILYDLGNVAWRTGRKLEAVGWYTASLRLRPRDGDTWANLEHARREAGLEPADRGDLGATVERALGAFDAREARLLALLGALGWAAALAFEALRGGRTARWTAAVATALALLLAVPWMRTALAERDDPLLVVTETPAPVRSEPRVDAAEIAGAQPGAVVERIDALPGWVAIELDDGGAGWVAAGAVFALRR